MDHLHETELIVRFRQRPGTDDHRHGVRSAEYEITWADGQPVQMGLDRFCNSGARLLLGRRDDCADVLIRLTLRPVAGLEADLTRPGRGIRCRRFYALRHGDLIRFHFFNGTPTEAVFSTKTDEPRVLRWLQACHMRPGVPFWFDLSSQTLANHGAEQSARNRVTPARHHA